MKQRLDLRNVQIQKLSLQQIQLAQMMELSTNQYEQHIYDFMEESGVVEEKEKPDQDQQPNQDQKEAIAADNYVPGYRMKSNNFVDSKDIRTYDPETTYTFQEHLNNQLDSYALTPTNREIVDFLIGSLDNNGYLKDDLLSLVYDLEFIHQIKTDEDTIAHLLENVVQKLDPVGVGCRNLRECLLLQLKDENRNERVHQLAIAVLENHFDLLSKMNLPAIVKKLGIDESVMQLVMERIKSCNPKPGSTFSSKGNQATQFITPDFFVEIVDGELVMSLNQRNNPNLKVCEESKKRIASYQRSLNKNQRKSQKDKEAYDFLKKKIADAESFIQTTKERYKTLSKTMQFIIDFQKDYLLSGDERKLKPLILMDVAEKVGLDVSTISRVSRSKYVMTPYGVRQLKFFFSESILSTSGDFISVKEVKDVLKSLLEQEDKHKPFSDQSLSSLLKEKGYVVARRTVAKYREQLGIPTSKMRRAL